MTDVASSTRRYLAAALPWLASERLIANGQTLPDAVFALTERQGNRDQISAVSRAAHTLGLRPGLGCADARARFPNLALVPHDAAEDAALLDALVVASDRYSPAVMAVPPDALVIDITGCTHPYGNEAAMACDLKRRLQREGLSAQVATGDTPDAAVARARFGVEALDRLPVMALGLDSKALTILRRAGLHNIGDITARPRAAFAARFPGLIDRLDRLTGFADSRIVPHRTPCAICAVVRFAEPVARVDDVLAMLDGLMGDVAIQLEERGEGGRAFEAVLFRSDNHVARLAVETGAPTRDAALVLRLIRERIDALADPLDPGFGYDLIRLNVLRSDPLGAHQPGLDAAGAAIRNSTECLDRLRTRLGRGAVLRFATADSHIPECAAFTAPQPQDVPGIDLPPRPLRLFDPPQRIEVMASVPDGPPKWFRWRGTRHDVVRREGPERIAPEWWRREGGHLPGQGGATRDYYRVEDSSGQRFWLFRHGLYGDRATPDWYIHGLFA